MHLALPLKFVLWQGLSQLPSASDNACHSSSQLPCAMISGDKKSRKANQYKLCQVLFLCFLLSAQCWSSNVRTSWIIFSKHQWLRILESLTDMDSKFENVGKNSIFTSYECNIYDGVNHFDKKQLTQYYKTSYWQSNWKWIIRILCIFR